MSHTGTLHQEALSFVYSAQKKCLWIAIVFVTDFFSLWSEFLMTYCSVLEKISVHKKGVGLTLIYF